MYCTSLRSQKQSYLGGFKQENGYQPCGRVMATFPLPRRLPPLPHPYRPGIGGGRTGRIVCGHSFQAIKEVEMSEDEDDNNVVNV